MKSITLFLLFLPALLTMAGPKSLNIGDTAPAFSLNNYDGKAHASAALFKDHKFTVLLFISTRCPVSNGYNERMEQLHETYVKSGVAVVGINSNHQETVDEITTHAKEKGFKFPVLKDEKNVVADAYGAQVTPEAFVVDQKGMLVYHGRIDDNRNQAKVKSKDLTTALDALLTGKELAVKESKAFGCSIKRMNGE